MTDDLLKQGIAALKEGRKAEARRLLAQVVEQDERNEMAWLWMGGVVDTDTERRICLENVLAINPNNGIAKRGLEGLGASQSTSPFATVRPLAPSAGGAATPGEQPIQPLATASEPDASDETERKERAKKKKLKQAPPPRRRSGLVIGLGVGLLGIVCIAVVGAWWAIDNGLLPFEPRPTLRATVDVGQTLAPAGADSTPTSGSASAPTWTPRPTDVPPTPIPTRTARPTKTPLLTWTPSLTPTATLTTTLTATPTPAMTLPPTWTPHPTSTPAPGITRPPTWTPHPTGTPAPGITRPPTWTPHPTGTLPPTWTPAYSTATPTITPTLTLTGTLATVTPGD